MKIISVASEKGGVGKTTSAVNIAAALAQLGKKVLLVDCDGQGSLTMHLGLDDEAKRRKKTIANFLSEPQKWKEVRLVRSNILKQNRECFLTVIPEFDRSITSMNEAMSDRLKGHKVLKNALSHVEGFDFCIIDSPPNLGSVLINVLVASTDVIIPLQTHIFSESGCFDLINDMEELKDLNPQLNLMGIFLNFFEKNKSTSKRILETAQEAFKDKLFKTKIPYSSAVKEGNAVELGLTLHEYAAKRLVKRPPVVSCYEELAKEIIERSTK